MHSSSLLIPTSKARTPSSLPTPRPPAFPRLSALVCTPIYNHAHKRSRVKRPFALILTTAPSTGYPLARSHPKPASACSVSLPQALLRPQAPLSRALPHPQDLLRARPQAYSCPQAPRSSAFSLPHALYPQVPSGTSPSILTSLPPSVEADKLTCSPQVPLHAHIALTPTPERALASTLAQALSRRTRALPAFAPLKRSLVYPDLLSLPHARAHERHVATFSSALACTQALSRARSQALSLLRAVRLTPTPSAHWRPTCTPAPSVLTSQALSFAPALSHQPINTPRCSRRHAHLCFPP